MNKNKEMKLLTKEQLEKLFYKNKDEFVNIYNELKEDFEFEIFFDFYDLEESLTDTSPAEIIQMVFFGNVTNLNDFVIINNVGNLETLSTTQTFELMYDKLESMEMLEEFIEQLIENEVI